MGGKRRLAATLLPRFPPAHLLRRSIRRRRRPVFFKAPAPIEQLGDVATYGDRALGFKDGLAGLSPEAPGKMGVVHFDVPQRQKGRWVKAAQRAKMKLLPWIMQALDEAAQKPPRH